MPELPEVESIRRQLVGPLTGRRISAIWIDHHPHARIHNVTDAINATIVAVERRGKFLVLPLAYRTLGPAAETLSNKSTRQPADSKAGVGATLLVLHLGMTGSLRIEPGDAAAGSDPHDRAAVVFDNRTVLRFRDPRRFGRFTVAAGHELARLVPTLATLGPEPLTDEFDPDSFARRLRRSTAPIKAVLLNQRVVAGVGNIYADEALWRAQIHPEAQRVGPRRARRLHAHLRDVLQEAIDREGTTFRDYQMVNGESGKNAPYLLVYGKVGQPCLRCGHRLVRLRVAQRGTTLCPSCQHR